MTFKQIKTALNAPTSARTIRHELHYADYRRYIACPRPFISRKQAKKRADFARWYRWWGISDFAAPRPGGGGLAEGYMVGRVYVWAWEEWEDLDNRRVDEKKCLDCIKLTYYSWRILIMIWGAIGWDYKSPLVFLEKEEGCRGVNSRVYRD